MYRVTVSPPGSPLIGRTVHPRLSRFDPNEAHQQLAVLPCDGSPLVGASSLSVHINTTGVCGHLGPGSVCPNPKVQDDVLCFVSKREDSYIVSWIASVSLSFYCVVWLQAEWVGWLAAPRLGLWGLSHPARLEPPNQTDQCYISTDRKLAPWLSTLTTLTSNITYLIHVGKRAFLLSEPPQFFN